MPKDTSTKHPCHLSEIGKLNRAAGQIEGVKRMIEEGRYCPEILTQLRAARAALRRIEADILETHLKSCVTDAITSGSAKDTALKIAELSELFKRYDE